VKVKLFSLNTNGNLCISGVELRVMVRQTSRRRLAA